MDSVLINKRLHTAYLKNKCITTDQQRYHTVSVSPPFLRSLLPTPQKKQTKKKRIRAVRVIGGVIVAVGVIGVIGAVISLV